jgi:hypothetical protein
MWMIRLAGVHRMAMSVRILLTSHDRCWSVGSLPCGQVQWSKILAAVRAAATARFCPVVNIACASELASFRHGTQ